MSITDMPHQRLRMRATAAAGPGHSSAPYELGSLAVDARLVDPATQVAELDALFNSDPRLRGVVVVDGRGRLSLIDRSWFGYQMAGPLGYGRMLHARSRVGDLALPRSVQLPHGTALDEAALEILADHCSRERIDAVVVTGPGPRVGVVQVSTIFEHLTREFAYQSVHDPLTGLPNRAYLMRRMRLEGQEPVHGLLYVDLDRFKDVNDRLGHDAGDQVLVQVSNRLRGLARSRDVVVRLGGDEFAFLVGSRLSAVQLDVLARGAVLATAAPFLVVDACGAEHSVTLGASVGVATSTEAGCCEPVDELLRRADLAMYGAKARGRGRAQHFDDSVAGVEQEQRHGRRSHDLERDLRRALELGAVDVHFQPVVRLPDGVVGSFEALARWTHGERGDVSPVEFIPVAERSGLIHDLGRHVLRRACATAMTWEPVGGVVPAVAVNASPRQLDDVELFVATVRNALADSGLPASRLVLEITESAELADLPTAAKALRRLREDGVTIALDDFGTGRASLDMLRALPLDIVKIDRSFTDAHQGSDADRLLLRLLIDAAHALGRTVVAEGVETHEQLAALAGMGVDHVQGWLLGRPEPDADPRPHSMDLSPVVHHAVTDQDDEFVVATTRDGRLTYVSASVMAVLGVPSSRLVGRSVGSLVHVEHPAIVRRLGLLERVVRVAHADGGHRLLRVRTEGWDETGEVSGVVLSRCRDVTDACEAEQAARRRQHALEGTLTSVFDGSPHPMALSDLTGRLVRVNRAFARLLERTPDELVGRTVAEITHADDRSRDAANLLAQRDGAAPTVAVRKRYLTADGRSVPVMVVTDLVIDADGNPSSLVAHVEPLDAAHRGG